MKVNGWTTTWKEWASTFGMMVGCTKVNTKTIKSTGMAFIPGLMADVMRAIGIEVNSMVWEHIWYRKTEKLNLDFGRMANELSGLMRLKSRPSITNN
jgi:hypothetical protein